MDQATATAIAELRGELGELRAALDTRNPEEAAEVVQRLRTLVQELSQGLQTFLAALDGQSPATPEAAAAELVQMKQTITALVAWAVTVSPPFTP